MKHLFLAGLVLFTGAKLAHAEVDAGVFEQFLGQNAPTCMDMAKIADVSTVTELNDAQFQFVRALYVALPPISTSLPPGGRAFKAESGKDTMVFLEDDGKACSRFVAPAFIRAMLDQVGSGEVVHGGAPL